MPPVPYSASEIGARRADDRNALCLARRWKIRSRFVAARYPPAFIAGGSAIHRPEMLILDEPTSGVDPVAEGYVPVAAYGRSFTRQDG